MPNTALNRTTQLLLTNKSGGAVVYGNVVIVDTTTDSSFTTTTTGGISTAQLGVVLEPNGIASNALGMVAVGGWAPRVTLNTAATRGQFIKSHTVAGQGTPHISPQVEGDFAVALEASATPAVALFGSPNGPLSGGSGTVTHTAGALTVNAVVIGNAGADVAVLAALGASGTVLTSNGAASPPSFQASTGKLIQVVKTQTGTVATGSTIIPLDNTIPQNTEGDQYMSLSITPTSATNNLQIDVVLMGSPNTTAWLTTALFQDSTANALAAFANYGPVGGAAANSQFRWTIVSGTTSATTFKVRAGAHTGATTFNGSTGSQFFGGVLASSITISEIVP